MWGQGNTGALGMSDPEQPEWMSELGSWFSFPCPPIPLPSLFVMFFRAS